MTAIPPPTPFPGTLHYAGPYKKAVLTEEQASWLASNFKRCLGTDLRAAMGVSLSTFYRICRDHGLERTGKDRARIWADCARRGNRTCRKNGYYKSLKGKRPSPQCMAAYRELLEKRKRGEAPSTWAVFREKHPRAYENRMRQRGEQRKKLIEAEKRRIVYGLPRKTRLRMIVLKPYTRSQCDHRWNALKRGYWVYEDCGEQSGERYNIYFDKDTRRSALFEANLRKDGFNVLDGAGL